MTSPNLAALQRQFGDALHYQPHDLPVEHGATSPDALLQVYRNNFVMTLSECLAVVYPVVKALVGDVCFDAIARQHVLNTPMKDACVDRYGEGFNDTIASIPNIIEAVPYLADMATLEWHIQTVNRAVVSPEPFPVEALALVSPEEFGDIHLHVSPAAKIIQSDFAISQIWDAVTRQDEAQLQSIDLNSAESVLIHLRHDTLTVIALDIFEAGLIDACAHSPFSDIAPEQLQHIASAMQRGVFTDFNLTRTP